MSAFRIRQGDYVTFVGPSGCGKSTIYRRLLGFEQPDSGTVFLDGHDLSSLDLNAVRGPMGIVLQNGQVVARSIYENTAALEEDIRAMPMGMRTVLPEGGTGLSVGQKQRLLARAPSPASGESSCSTKPPVRSTIAPRPLFKTR